MFFPSDQCDALRQRLGEGQTRSRGNPRPTETNRGQNRLGQGPERTSVCADSPGDGTGRDTHRFKWFFLNRIF